MQHKTDAARERYKFNVTKTKTVSVNCKIAPLLLLNNDPLGSSTSETHIGNTRTMSNTDKETIRNRVKKAWKTSYSLMGAGMHGLNGTGPTVVMIQYTTYQRQPCYTDWKLYSTDRAKVPTSIRARPRLGAPMRKR